MARVGADIRTGRESDRTMDIKLQKITPEGMNELDRGFQRDPATFADMSLFSEYRYSPEKTRKLCEAF